MPPPENITQTLKVLCVILEAHASPQLAHAVGICTRNKTRSQSKNQTRTNAHTYTLTRTKAHMHVAKPSGEGKRRPHLPDLLHQGVLVHVVHVAACPDFIAGVPASLQEVVARVQEAVPLEGRGVEPFFYRCRGTSPLPSQPSALLFQPFLLLWPAPDETLRSRVGQEGFAHGAQSGAKEFGHGAVSWGKRV